MSSLTATKPHWWAPGLDGLTTKTKLGTAAVLLSFVLVTVMVLMSPAGTPTGPDSSAARADSAAGPAEPAPDLAAPPPAPEPRLLGPVPEEDAPADQDADPQEDTDAHTQEGLTDRPRNNRSGGTRDTAPRVVIPAAPGPANPRNPTLPDPAPEPEPPVVPEPEPTPDPEPEPTPSAPVGAPEPTAPEPEPGPEPTPEPEPEPDTVTAPPKADLLQPEHRYYGMYTVQSPFNWAEVNDVAARTGRLPDLAGYFNGWDKEFRADAVTRSWERGMLPMLTWESRPSGAANDQETEEDYTLPAIIGDPEAGVPGAYDDYLRRYAEQVAALGLPLVIRLDHEMNGDWYPWSEMDKQGDPINGNRPGDFAAMWRHVHDIFEVAGANEHVIWLWSPNITNNLPENLRGPDYLQRLYPGDEYVDWVGVSGYYRPPYREDQTPTFQFTYDRTLDQLRELTDKPILLSEIGASEVGGKKAAWVTSFFEGLARPENADVIGFAWFNLVVTSTVRGELVTNDWRVNSHRSTLDAFVSGLTSDDANIGGTPYPGSATVPEPSSQPSDDGERTDLDQ